MTRGLGEGLMEDLWNFPAAFGDSAVEARQSLCTKLHHLTRAPFTLGEPITDFRHGITFRSIQGRVYPVESSCAFRHASLRWFELKSLPQAAISQLARKIVQKIA
jgi:adenine-specific DNA glycosylase